MSDSINLSSKTHMKTNPISANSMCLLPDKKSTKIFVAHAKGVHIYDNISQKIDDVKISETSGTASCLTQSDDLVFFCFGMRIYACGANGKTLFEADTYLAVDKIESIHVYGYQLWAVTGNMVNEFLIGGTQLNNNLSRITPPPSQKIQDMNSYIYDVKINHSLLLKLDTQKPFLLLLKNNNQIQIAQKKDPTTFTTETPPTYCYLYPSSSKNKVLVGTMSGELMYVEVEKKKITKLWSIKENSKGKVNCIVQVKNGFMVFRDGVYEMWNANRECLGKEEFLGKIVSALYLPEEESFFYGTAEGQMVEMFNYEKMMRLAKDRGQTADKMKLVRQIEELRKLKAELKIKADQLGMAKETISGGGKNIKISTNLSVDYVNFCYSLEVSSERPIIRLVLRGCITLLESPDRIIFQGFDKQKTKVYTLRTQQKNLLTVKLKFPQKYQQNDKLICMIFSDLEGSLFASKQSVDLKFLSLHQKIASKLLDSSNLKANVLRVTGEFKYFLMNNWLNALFNDFGSPSIEAEEQIELCYESLITKNKVYIQYRDRQCVFYSESPAPLAVIKKTIFQKSKEKNLSLSYDSKTNIEGLANLLKKMAPKLKRFQQNRREHDLLPGIQELEGEGLSSDLKSILARSDSIKSCFLESAREYEELTNSIKQFYISYRALNGWEINEYKISELIKQIENFEPEKIIKMIQS